MDKDYLKETIKLFKEFLRGFFALFIFDTSAFATLLVRQKFFESSFEYNLLIITLYIDIIIIIIIIGICIKTYKLIKLLKQ